MAPRWSLLVYMTATKQLRPHVERTLKELAAGGAAPGLDVVLQVDRGEGKPPVRYRIVGRKAVAVREKWAYRARTALADFIDWGLPERGRTRSFLVVWGEGDGWNDRSGLVRDKADGATDAEFRDAIGRAARAPIDLIGCDACLMSMIEIAYGLRTVGRFHIASETLEPLSGWPYPRMLEALARRPHTAPRDCAVRVVRSLHRKGPVPADKATTLAAFDLQRMDAVAGAFKAVAQRLRRIGRSHAAQIARAREVTVHVGNPQYVDAFSLTRALTRHVGDRPLRTAVRALDRELLRARVANAKLGKENDGMSGISLFFPPTPTHFLGPYRRLEFAEATGWGAFLEDYFARAPRATVR